ncbi:MAG: transcriptional regulator MntR [Ignavibacteriales bacterium]
MNNNDFLTFSNYMKKDKKMLTASMEDYLEMIYRLSSNANFTRINDLSKALNVHPPSATRMVQRLGKLNYLKYEKYGMIILKGKGLKLGKLLLTRHNTIESFLSLLGISKEEVVKETEKIEHTVSAETTKCLNDYINFAKDNPDVITKFKEYREKELP